jgi:hypothetical protein
MRSRPKLPPHQYVMRLVNPNPKRQSPGPYLVYRSGMWKLYRSRWKCQGDAPGFHVGGVSAPTIPGLPAVGGAG